MIRLRLFLVILVFAILSITVSSTAQVQQNKLDKNTILSELKTDRDFIKKDLHKHKQDQLQALQKVNPAVSIPQALDIKHYKLNISLVPETSGISGTVDIIGETLQSVNSIKVNVLNNLTVKSLKFNGMTKTFRREGERISLDFDNPLDAKTQFTITVDYQGSAAVVGRIGGGMLVSNHQGALSMASLSEPFAAPSWWPCIDDPADKTTVEMAVTVPAGYEEVSNGVLVKTESNPNGSKTFFWREDYPISNYLVSVATTNYSKFQDTYTTLDGATVPLFYYVYPEHLDGAKRKFAVTPQAMNIYAKLFGEYPFVNEKYGMAEFPWGGAMEHQTMTSMGQGIVGGSSSGTLVTVHELAHQWWGDLVTLSSWHDIWLNEGFATYSEVLFLEKGLLMNPGKTMTQYYDDGQPFGDLGGTVYADDADPFGDIGAVYDKGAWVLHMLRHVMGDNSFFDALKDYRTQYAYSNASTDKFRQVCEAHYGKSLKAFFDQWVMAPSRPIYKVSTRISNNPGADGKYQVIVSVRQKQNITIPNRTPDMKNVFVMPIDLTFHFANGRQETQTVVNDSRKQMFIFSLSEAPTNIGFDEGNWILKAMQ